MVPYCTVHIDNAHLGSAQFQASSSLVLMAEKCVLVMNETVDAEIF